MAIGLLAQTIPLGQALIGSFVISSKATKNNYEMLSSKCILSIIVFTSNHCQRTLNYHIPNVLQGNISFLTQMYILNIV